MGKLELVKKSAADWPAAFEKLVEEKNVSVAVRDATIINLITRSNEQAIALHEVATAAADGDRLLAEKMSKALAEFQAGVSRMQSQMWQVLGRFEARIRDLEEYASAPWYRRVRKFRIQDPALVEARSVAQAPLDLAALPSPVAPLAPEGTVVSEAPPPVSQEVTDAAQAPETR
jgi:hypothetical protein